MNDDFLLCEYFNARERCVHRVLIAKDDETGTRIKIDKPGQQAFVKRLAMTASKAETPERVPSLQDCATAVQALIKDVTSEQMPLALARKVTHVRVNFAKAVAVADVIPTLEASYGGHSASWARAIFQRRDSGPVGVH